MNHIKVHCGGQRSLIGDAIRLELTKIVELVSKYESTHKWQEI